MFYFLLSQFFRNILYEVWKLWFFTISIYQNVNSIISNETAIYVGYTSSQAINPVLIKGEKNHQKTLEMRLRYPNMVPYEVLFLFSNLFVQWQRQLLLLA